MPESKLWSDNKTLMMCYHFWIKDNVILRKSDLYAYLRFIDPPFLERLERSKLYKFDKPPQELLWLCLNAIQCNQLDTIYDYPIILHYCNIPNTENIYTLLINNFENVKDMIMKLPNNDGMEAFIALICDSVIQYNHYEYDRDAKRTIQTLLDKMEGIEGSVLWQKLKLLNFADRWLRHIKQFNEIDLAKEGFKYIDQLTDEFCERIEGYCVHVDDELFEQCSNKNISTPHQAHLLFSAAPKYLNPSFFNDKYHLLHLVSKYERLNVYRPYRYKEVDELYLVFTYHENVIIDWKLSWTAIKDVSCHIDNYDTVGNMLLTRLYVYLKKMKMDIPTIQQIILEKANELSNSEYPILDQINVNKLQK